MGEERSILLVEDDPDIRDALADALEAEGYKVATAADGLDALEHLRAGPLPPRLILLDLMMPRMNGEQFCEARKEISGWEAIPVVVLSADARAKERALACRATSYLQKPVKLALLFSAVARALAADPLAAEGT